jgi:phospholipid/cholesterol/gamma-HCH transport system permease protein
MKVAIRQEAGTLVTSLAGDWEIGTRTPRFDDLVGEAPDGSRLTAIAFETTELGEWDSSLLTFLMQGVSYCEDYEIEFRQEDLPVGISRLISLARAVPEKDVECAAPTASLVDRIGASGIVRHEQFLRSVTFVGETAGAVVGLFTRRVKMRWREFWVVVQSNGSGALPIVTLISFLVGLIIAFLGAVVLRRFGAGYYVSYLVGYGMLREMGALMTGIIIAGRTGAAFAAELGSMKITEEIDAYETLGISPVEHLVLPRVLGLFVMMPLLTIYAMFVGILGGLLVSITLLDLSAVQFIGGLLTPVTVSDGLLGVFKGLVFGSVIGLSGCMRGMQTGSDAGAVGRAATSAVVTGITLIIVANAIIDWLAALVGV